MAVRRHDLIMAAAKEDQDTVSELTQALVRIPSRAGIDPYDRIVDRLSGWMRNHGLATTLLRDGTGAVVGLTAEIRGSHLGPRWVLDACLDTAPFGDEHAWTHSPTSGVVENGWMWGRGSADSKAAVAIFCHLATRLAASTEQLHGGLVVLFDLDEHTGRFGGARQYFEGPDAPNDIAGVMIGYPGMDKLVIGGRGVYRAELHVHGTASHSGASRSTPNAIDKAAHLVQELGTTDLPGGTSADFPLPGKLTVTAIEGGQGYSVTPDVCTLNIDIRTTRTFNDEAAATLINHVTTRVDERCPTPVPRLSSSPPAGRPTLSQPTPGCAPPCCKPRTRSASTPNPRSPVRLTSATTSQDSESPRPPASASPTPACTPPTNASGLTPSPVSKPSTTPPASPP